MVIKAFILNRSFTTLTLSRIDNIETLVVSWDCSETLTKISLTREHPTNCRPIALISGFQKTPFFSLLLLDTPSLSLSRSKATKLVPDSRSRLPTPSRVVSQAGRKAVPGPTSSLRSSIWCRVTRVFFHETQTAWSVRRSCPKTQLINRKTYSLRCFLGIKS